VARFHGRPVANGLRTDHPIPELPFVDDSHLPLDDPRGIAAIGRHDEGPGWGGTDRSRSGGWAAFTTEMRRPELAWCVRWHPEHGRSVVLMRNDQAANLHDVTTWDPPLLFRSGGYWWDGQSWFRPMQVWDRASGRYESRPVPAASTVTAADLLADRAASDHLAPVMRIEAVSIDHPVQLAANGRWLDHLARWAEQRARRDAGDDAELLPLSACVVRLSAPELAADQMVGVAELAELAGIATPTLRSYISRGQSDIPQPQATLSGRHLWSRAVAQEWLEARANSSEGITELMATGRFGETPVPEGMAELANQLTGTFFARLWTNPARRSRWALKWRNEAAVREVAQGLSWDVALNLDMFIPLDDLKVTIEQAAVGEMAMDQRQRRARGEADEWFRLQRQTGHMLGWLARYAPDAAADAIGEIVGRAERELGIPRPLVEEAVREAINLDSGISKTLRRQFLARVLTTS
jgi:hypothetical protein